MESKKKLTTTDSPNIVEIYESIKNAQKKGRLRIYLRNMEIAAAKNPDKTLQLLDTITKAEIYLESYLAPPQEVLEELAILTYSYINSTLQQN